MNELKSNHPSERAKTWHWLLLLALGCGPGCARSEADADAEMKVDPSKQGATDDATASNDAEPEAPTSESPTSSLDDTTAASEADDSTSAQGNVTPDPTAKPSSSLPSSASHESPPKTPGGPASQSTSFPEASSPEASASAPEATPTVEGVPITSELPTGLGSSASAGGAGNLAPADAGGPPASDLPIAMCTSDLGGIASAKDFSINADSGQYDHHVLLLRRGDLIRRIFQYVTTGDADHQHDVYLDDARLNALLAGEAITVTTDPPSTAATGHTHTVHVTACPEL